MPKVRQKSEWDIIAEKWDKAVGETGIWHQQHDINPLIFKLSGKVKNKKILEIGCGNGYLSRKFAKKGAKVTAIDLSPKLIKLAFERERAKTLGITYLVRDAARLSGLKNKSFDLAAANMSLMDIADVERAISEVSRVLKTSGIFVFSSIHPISDELHWAIMEDRGQRRFGRFVYRYLTPYAEKKDLIQGAITKLTGYHRPIEAYFRYLRNAGFWVDELLEIASTRPVTKAAEKDGDVTLRRSKYKTPAEKKMKEMAGKEIPLFLVVKAIKK